MVGAVGVVVVVVVVVSTVGAVVGAPMILAFSQSNCHFRPSDFRSAFDARSTSVSSVRLVATSSMEFVSLSMSASSIGFYFPSMLNFSAST